MIYLDNAATSWPKPPQVIQAMLDILKRGCANPGRSAHAMARQAEDVVLNTRGNHSQVFQHKRSNADCFYAEYYICTEYSHLRGFIRRLGCCCNGNGA